MASTQDDANPFSLGLPEGETRKLALGWLWVGIASLIGSGLVVILVILARIPGVSDLLPWIGSFRTALVIHVDLSVLAWFLAFAAFLAALPLKDVVGKKQTLGWLGLGLSALGTLILTFSPLLGANAPHMNNYIPVVENNAFFLGSGLFTLGFALMAFHSLMAKPKMGLSSMLQAQRLGLNSGLVIALIAVLFVFWSYLDIRLDAEVAKDREYFYEVLFWSGGHVLQFTHTQLLALVWFWLSAMLISIPLSARSVAWVYLIGAAPILSAPIIQAIYPADDPLNRFYFTELMRFGNGIIALMAGTVALFALFKGKKPTPEMKPAYHSLIVSLALFAGGGIIGFMIVAINTTIPAHYHGSIVSVTVAYMGLTFYLLPKLGYPIRSLRLATWQPIIYGVGQFMHVAGLAWSGAHGVQRKTAGAAQELDTLATKTAMTIMGIGGLMAVLAVVFFIFIAWQALTYRKQ
ncbi:cbb3-type cytochrome c oxidase subunit I [Magnetococcales bacterium HHB-1]